MINHTPKAFISYSWKNPEVKSAVLDLATSLTDDGVDVLLDEWDTSAGNDMFAFMERSVTDPSVDWVLIICDKSYAEKANDREGGVGTETTIISPEVYGRINQKKYIPLVIERDEEGHEYRPAYLRSAKYIDISGDNYESGYNELLHHIFDEPIHKKPPLGKRPDFSKDYPTESEIKLRSSLRSLKGSTTNVFSALSNCNSIAVASLDFVDSYVEALSTIYHTENFGSAETYLDDFAKTLSLRGIFIDYVCQIIRTGSDESGDIIASMLEKLRREVGDPRTFDANANSWSPSALEIMTLHVWELFICTTTVLLHYEQYEAINKLINRTYFTEASYYGEKYKEQNYVAFYEPASFLEETIKPLLPGDGPRKYTLSGDLLCTKRQAPPLLSTASISEADLFLFQIYNAFDYGAIDTYWDWFPKCYIYGKGRGFDWSRLKSRRFCKKIMPLFGLDSSDKSAMDELREKISKCEKPNSNYGYGGSYIRPTAILEYVKPEEIGTEP